MRLTLRFSEAVHFINISLKSEHLATVRNTSLGAEMSFPSSTYSTHKGIPMEPSALEKTHKEGPWWNLGTILDHAPIPPLRDAAVP